MAGTDCAEVELSARAKYLLVEDAVEGVFDSTDGVVDVRVVSS